MRKVVIASAVRTPIGSFGGSLASLSSVELGVIAAKEALKRAGITAEQVEDVIIGNVLAGGQGQGVARQISINTGVPKEVPAMTINLICGSGLRSVSLAAQQIALGDADIILCGGTESMSNSVHALKGLRFGMKFGNTPMLDTMVLDGLTDAFSGVHMGITAENIAEQWNISRESQDKFAVESQNKAEAAQKAGRFDAEIVPVVIPSKKGDIVVDKDEYIKHGATLDSVAKLKPAFKKDGTVTAANASGLNDGACMLVVMSEDKAKELGVKPLATIKAYATKGVDPSIMGIGPVPATEAALKSAGWKVDDLDLVEANEAFASQSIAVVRDLGLDPQKVNVNGGAIALGHPIGCSGARILTTLLYEMERRDAKKGLATLCIGGGMGTSVLVER